MKGDVEKHGATEGCPGCRAVMRGATHKAPHTAECRLRMEDLVNADAYGAARIRRAMERAAVSAAEPQETSQQGGEVGTAAEPPTTRVRTGDGRTVITEGRTVTVTDDQGRLLPGSRTIPGPPIPARPTATAASSSQSIPVIPSQPTQRLPPPAQPGMTVTGAGNNSPRSRSSKRAADEPADDPRVENADSPEVITERGSKRAAEFPPEDPRLSEPGQASQVIHDPPTSSVEMDHSRKCAKCLKEFKSKSALHQHLRDAGHQVVDGHDTEEEIDSIEARRSRIQRHRRDQIDHYDKVQKMTGCDVPGAKEESMDSLSSGHPGQKIKRHEILA